MNKLWEQLVRNVNEAMVDQGISRADLLKRLKWPSPALSKIMTGKNEPGLDKIQALADALNLPPSDLIAPPKSSPIFETARKLISRVNELHAQRVPMSVKIRELNLNGDDPKLRQDLEGQVKKIDNEIKATQEELNAHWEKYPQFRIFGPHVPKPIPTTTATLTDVVDRLDRIEAKLNPNPSDVALRDLLDTWAKLDDDSRTALLLTGKDLLRHPGRVKTAAKSSAKSG